MVSQSFKACVVAWVKWCCLAKTCASVSSVSGIFPVEVRARVAQSRATCLCLEGSDSCVCVIEVWTCELQMSHSFQQLYKILYSSQFVAADCKKPRMLLVLVFTPLRVCVSSLISLVISRSFSLFPLSSAAKFLQFHDFSLCNNFHSFQTLLPRSR